MNVKEVTIGGETRPISFGTNALAAFFDSQGLTLADLNKLGEVLTLRGSTELFYYGFVDGYRKAKKEVDFTKLDIGDWLDDEPGGMQVGIEKLMILVQNSFPDAEPEKKRQKKRVAKAPAITPKK